MGLIKDSNKYFYSLFLLFFISFTTYAEGQKLIFKYENSVFEESLLFTLTMYDENCILNITGKNCKKLKLPFKDDEISFILKDIFNLVPVILDNENNFPIVNSDIIEQIIIKDGEKEVIFLYYGNYNSIPSNGTFSNKIVTLTKQLISTVQQRHSDLFVGMPEWLYK